VSKKTFVYWSLTSRGPWRDDDTRWFKKNPNRFHRIRTAHSGELSDWHLDVYRTAESLVEPVQIITKREPGGARCRIPIIAHSKIAVDEDSLRILFDQTEREYRTEQPHIDVQNLDELARWFKSRKIKFV